MRRSKEQALFDFLRNENIERFRKLLTNSTDKGEREQLRRLLAEEKTKLNAEIPKNRESPEKPM